MVRRFAIGGSLGVIFFYVAANMPLLARESFAVAAVGIGLMYLACQFRRGAWAHPAASNEPVIDLTTIRPDDFERYTARVLAGLGSWQCERVGGSGDQGIDVIMRDALGRLVGVAQCKHREKAEGSVGPSVIRDMDSTKHRHGARIAYVVTNGRFTNGARELAQSYDIRLLDGYELTHLQNRSKSSRKLLTIRGFINSWRFSRIGHNSADASPGSNSDTSHSGIVYGASHQKE